MSDLYGSPMGSGLMSMFANPQTAGLLGMAGGLLQASGPSRLPISNGQAIGMGLQGIGAGMNNALQMQRGLMQMRMLQGLMGDQGGAQQAPAPASASQPMSPVGGSANVGPMSGLAAGMGGMAPSPAASATSASSAYPATPAPSAGPLVQGKTPAQLMREGQMWGAIGYPQIGGPMISAALSAQAPTDAQKMAGAAYGYGTPEYQAAIQSQVRKAGYQQPLNSRPGTIIRDPYTMQPLAFNPNVTAGGRPLFDASGNVVAMNAIPGAAGVASAMAAAKAGGEGSVLPYSGVDARGNPLPVTNRTAAATQNGDVPAPLRNNNPGALMPGGRLAQYPDMQTGLAQLDSNLQSYGKQGVNTLAGVISKWAPPNENNTQAYIQDVSQRLGVKPDQPIDLSNPAVRQAISTGIMLHENGPGAVFSPPAASRAPGVSTPAVAGAIYAAPPLGATTAANASQGAPSKQMADMQQRLADSDNTYQASRQALMKMIGITQNGGLYDAGMRMLPESVSTRISTDAAEYQKAHSNFVALQGKALGAGGTDTSRETLDESVPTFEKPTDAKISGLTDQLNQLDWNHLKRQTLNPTFTAGNEKAYSDLGAKFDSAIPITLMPKLMPILSMPTGPARTQALQQAIRDPQMKGALDLMVQTGQLK